MSFFVIIRAICKADASAVLGFETTLFPVIQEILSNDVTGRQLVTSRVSCSVWLEWNLIFASCTACLLYFRVPAICFSSFILAIGN